MNVSYSPEFFTVGGNRNPAAADWDEDGQQLLAYGADCSIALWDAQDPALHGVRAILNGHTKSINAVKFFSTQSRDVSILLSGSADHSLRLWRNTGSKSFSYECLKVITDHTGPITRIATLPSSDVFATGSSDGTVKIWKLIHNADFSSVDVELSQTITLAPKYFPLNLALASLDEKSTVLAVAGTRTTIQIFVSQDGVFQLAATLTGHEGWIRSLDFVRENSSPDDDLLLASASQDKYIRLWRINRGNELPAASAALNDPALGGISKSLSNKAHWIESAASKYSITFEALLLGHEDWIYTASWRHRSGKLQLLSTSEDNSLAIWESDPSSGVWICATRLGEISAQKGSTSATGSAGGFWIGLWSPDGNTVVSLGRTGSWRTWGFSTEEDMWKQQLGITGHVRETRGVCWSRDGRYMLTTSSDQTTRLFAEWKRGGSDHSWHEFSRPQIHGYDLNCIDTVNNSQFISGADEKLLRVFDEPKGVAEMLSKLCDIKSNDTTDLPDAANIPVLGLSNKAIQAVEDEAPVDQDEDEREAVDPASIVRKSTLDLSQPPFEDHLARHLLWPETEKLYGHGYEISTMAISRDGSLVATACRASSVDHAVIRLYDTKDWLEIKPPLKAHSLTVTALQFSHDDKYLLSVGRDRQWVVWERNIETSVYEKKYSDPKGHSRMILGASWAPFSPPIFITSGRDKTVKIWSIKDDKVTMMGSIDAGIPVTAVACNSKVVDDRILFAYGTENGDISIGSMGVDPVGSISVTARNTIDAAMAPAKAINQISWRPGQEDNQQQIAVASDDTSVRIYNVKIKETA